MVRKSKLFWKSGDEAAVVQSPFNINFQNVIQIVSVGEGEEVREQLLESTHGSIWN